MEKKKDTKDNNKKCSRDLGGRGKGSSKRFASSPQIEKRPSSKQRK